ncbi:choice-of-anchor D domain-containing protein [Pseudenhygromyxa sp. WMMC2535]|uniref:choice-of-anchor D domain-containing protein n=1 Tax=Pseudenhygromyxa sp. WMMC2535 TaxID=2712867 RepID=UPI0015518FD6|nr:choice-of-anchor D domain-containing protein [Pseudenhygromyxa sp. WMMC2535]NVB38264.1 choice-of-anchor D domain-containing protein [Pseudenhygromyxa sp. WMMC2535]
MIKISTIFYDGVEKRTEGDEYIEIVNDGPAPVDLSKWVVDAGPASATNSQKFSPLQAPDPWVSSTLLPGGEGTHDFGSQSLGSARQKVVFTIENRRPDQKLELNGMPLVAVSEGAPAFVVEQQPTTPIPGLAKVQFEVSFEPSAIGSIPGELIIPIEGLAQPLHIPLVGAGVAKGKLELLHGGAVLATGDDLDLGKQPLGASTATAFCVENSGGSDVELTSLALSNTTDFELRNLPSLPRTLAPGQRVDFELVFAPASAGTKQTTLTVSGGSGTIELALEGRAEALEPNIDLRCGGALVAEGGNIDMGTATVGASGITKHFTISNTGKAALHIAKLGLSGGGGAYSVSPALTGQTLQPGASVNFTLRFEPKHAAVPSAQLTVVSDDPDQGQYTFNLSGRALVPVPAKKPQELAVKQYYSYTRIFDVPMANGQHVDFDMNQTGQVGYGCVTLCYYVENHGESNLTIHSASVSNSANFLITGDVGTPSGRRPSLPRVLPPRGRLILFLVYRMQPGSPQTTLTLRTDDPNNSTFSIDINVTGGASASIGGNNLGGGYPGGGYPAGGNQPAWMVHTNNHGNGRGLQVQNGGQATVPGQGTTYIEVLPPGGRWGSYSWQGVNLIIDGGFNMLSKTNVPSTTSPTIFSIACMQPGASVPARLIYNGATVHSFQLVGQYGL